MMQPISYTTKAYKSREGGFNHAAVSMTTSYIKWPSTRTLSSSSLSHLPLEQLGQDKSQLHFSTACTALHRQRRQPDASSPHADPQRGAQGACFLLPLQLLITCLDDKSFQVLLVQPGEALFSGRVSQRSALADATTAVTPTGVSP